MYLREDFFDMVTTIEKRNAWKHSISIDYKKFEKLFLKYKLHNNNDFKINSNVNNH